MDALETYQAAQARLAAASANQLDAAQAAVAAAARNLRREEILAMPPGPNRDALLAPLGADPEPVELPPEPDQAAQLRIFSVPGLPERVRSAYQPEEPPTDYDFGMLGLQKASTLRPSDKGDIPQMRYSHDGVDVCRRLFAFSYDTDPKGAIELTVTETPGWARNDGDWIDGPERTQVYSGARYNQWRDSARQRIFGGLKTWLPLILEALEEVEDIPAGEALSGAWLAQNHAAPWNVYMSSGRKELITASLTADGTLWLSSEVPAGLLEGVEPGTTVRQLILGSLR